MTRVSICFISLRCCYTQSHTLLADRKLTWASYRCASVGIVSSCEAYATKLRNSILAASQLHLPAHTVRFMFKFLRCIRRWHVLWCAAPTASASSSGSLEEVSLPALDNHFFFDCLSKWETSIPSSKLKQRISKLICEFVKNLRPVLYGDVASVACSPSGIIRYCLLVFVSAIFLSYNSCTLLHMPVWIVWAASLVRRGRHDPYL